MSYIDIDIDIVIDIHTHLNIYKYIFLIEKINEQELRESLVTVKLSHVYFCRTHLKARVIKRKKGT